MAFTPFGGVPARTSCHCEPFSRSNLNARCDKFRSCVKQNRVTSIKEKARGNGILVTVKSSEFAKENDINSLPRTWLCLKKCTGRRLCEHKQSPFARIEGTIRGHGKGNDRRECEAVEEKGERVTLGAECSIIARGVSSGEINGGGGRMKCHSGRCEESHSSSFFKRPHQRLGQNIAP